MRRKRLNQAGDTIIEVLLAVVIVGLAVGLAYGISTRSLRSARQAQERTEAVKLAEGQVEKLKGVVARANASDLTSIFDTNNVFCVNDAGAVEVFSGSYGNDIKSLQATDALTNYPDDAGDTLCVEGLYYMGIEEQTSNSSEFAIVVRWSGLGTGKNEEVKIKYRLYRP